MPQQLSLYASIPESEIKITLHTLSSVTGMSPSPLLEHTLLWQPRHPHKPVLAAGQVNQIEQYRIRLANDLLKVAASSSVPDDVKLPHSNESDEDIATKMAVVSYSPQTQATLKTREWTFSVAELPEAGKLSVISQSIVSVQPTYGNPFEFLDRLGYIYKHEYWTSGYQFVHGNIVVQIFRLSGFDTASYQQQLQQHTEDAPALLGGNFLKLLDSTLRWTMSAFINVESITDLDAIVKATAELERFRLDLVGLLDLELPERNCFDNRVKRR